MTYITKEKSVDKGAPVEFYKFIGEFMTFRYTTDDVPGVVDGEIYLPIEGGIRRSSIEVSTAIDDLITTDITIPADTDLAKQYCFKATPKPLRIEIRRAHRGDDWSTDFNLEWVGYSLSTSVSGLDATIRTGSMLQANLSGALNPVLYQRLCNHTLYDARCGVQQIDWTILATVTKVQGQVIHVDFDGGVNRAFDGGEMRVIRTDEVRTIFLNEDLKFTVSFPYLDIVVGDQVLPSYGCDHRRLGHCKNRFNNVINYGGFDFVPASSAIAQAQTTINASTTEQFRAKPVVYEWVKR